MKTRRTRIRKHRKDYAHCPGGMVSGNVRYNRNCKKMTPGDRSMGKARTSCC